MKVQNFKNKNQYVLEDKKNLQFQSYNSTVASIDKKNGNLILGIDWNYSQTTVKYLFMFLLENINILNEKTKKYFFNFKDIKNKKKYIEKLIDEKIIKYDDKLI